MLSSRSITKSVSICPFSSLPPFPKNVAVESLSYPFLPTQFVPFPLCIWDPSFAASAESPNHHPCWWLCQRQLLLGTLLICRAVSVGGSKQLPAFAWHTLKELVSEPKYITRTWPPSAKMMKRWLYCCICAHERVWLSSLGQDTSLCDMRRAFMGLFRARKIKRDRHPWLMVLPAHQCPCLPNWSFRGPQRHMLGRLN